MKGLEIQNKVKLNIIHPKLEQHEEELLLLLPYLLVLNS